MSFAGALGRGLLGAVGGGAQSYIDDQELKQKEAAETAKMEKMAKIEQEVWAARQKAIEEQRVASEQGQYDRGKQRKKEDQAGLVGVMNQYETLAQEGIKSGKDKRTAYIASSEKAMLAGEPEAAEAMAKLAGEDPAATQKRLLEMDKLRAETAKMDADTGSSKFHNVPEGSMVLDERTGKRVAQVPKTYAPQSSAGGGGSAKEDKFTDAQFKAAFHRNTLKQELKGNSVSSSTVSELDEAKYRRFVTWAESNGLHPGPAAYNRWIGVKGGSSSTAAGNPAAGASRPARRWENGKLVPN